MNMLELVDQLLERFKVPFRDKTFVTEPAHVLACALRADPGLEKYNEKQIVLFAVSQINYHAKRMKKEGIYEVWWSRLDGSSENERRLLEEMGDSSWSIFSYLLGHEHVVVAYEKDGKFFNLYDSDDERDELNKKLTTENFNLI